MAASPKLDSPVWLRVSLIAIVLLAGCTPPAAAPTQTLPEPPVANAVVETNPPAEATEPAAVTVTPQAQDAAASAAREEDGRYWVVNQTDQVLIAIDPDSNAVSARVGLAGELGPLAFGEGYLWLVQSFSTSSDVVLKINPRSLSVEGAYPVEQGDVVAITAGLGSVWLGIRKDGSPEDRSPGDYRLPGGLARLEPQGSDRLDFLSVDYEPTAVVSGEGSVWVLGQYDVVSVLVQYDPAGQEVMRHPQPGHSYASGEIYQFARLTLHQNALWAVSSDTRSPYIYKVDPANGQITAMVKACSEPGDSPFDIAAGTDRVWVGCRSGRVSAVDPATQETSVFIDLGQSLSAVRSANGSVWAESGGNAVVYRIDPATNHAAEIPTGQKPVPTATRAPRALEEVMCEADYPTRLEAGGVASVASEPPIPNRVREQPDTGARILGEIDPGEVVHIMEGPVCTAGWVWWKVRSEKDGLTGWTAEGDREGYWLVPEE